jgi:predicted NBD/HSP70 family sugar kinase
MTNLDAKSQLLKNVIIKQLYYNKPLSLSEVSKLSNKSLPLITKVIQQLVVEGYVIEQGLGPSTGGRRASLFLLNAERHKYIVSIAMDQFITRMMIFDLNNTSRYEISIELPLIDNPEATDQLTQFIQINLKKSGIPQKHFLGIGIGVPGFVNADLGISHSYLHTEDGSPLATYLSAKIGLPVFLDNDSSLIALAELRYGAAVGKRNVMVANIGWGTGLGMIVNGSLYRGSSGYAGEFSHIPLSKSDNLCSCGKRGCLEVETSLLVMTERANAAIASGAATSMRRLSEDKSKNIAQVFLEAAKEHDPLAVSILSEAAFMIGKGLATLIHIMNPECIVLSGRAAVAGKVMLPPIQQALNEFCIPRIASQTTIVQSELAENAQLLAAASLVIEHAEF